jgi:rhodanese-related sulfurtransferase
MSGLFYFMKVILFILALLVITSCGIHSLTKQGVYQELAPEVYLNYVKDSSVNIIDVRTNAEFEKSHINGAVNVNYFGGHFKRDLMNLSLDTSKATLIYCETQHRSLFVAKKIKKAGFLTIIDLDKGMMNWRKKGFPYFNQDTISK